MSGGDVVRSRGVVRCTASHQSLANFRQNLEDPVGKQLIGNCAIYEEMYHYLHPYMCLQVNTTQYPGTVRNRVLNFQNLLDFSERKRTNLFSILLECSIPEQSFLRTIVFDHPRLILANLNYRRRAPTWCR